jgi:hypothetical protein
MRGVVQVVLVVCVALLAGDPALAEEAAKPLHWWEIASGILAIPVAVIGFVFSYATFVKTRLEAQKIELEIREKQKALAESGNATPEVQQVAQSLIEPLVDNARVNYIIMRFILLYLVLLFWDVFAKALSFIATGAFLTWTNILKMPSQGAPVIIMYGATQLAQFGWILIVLVVGAPLYKDIARHVNFRLLWWKGS